MKAFLVILFLPFILFAQKQDTVKEYFNNGKIKTVYVLQNGVREGAGRFYYESGSIKEELSYTNGRVDGFVKRYYENGNVKETFNIEKGRREGSALYYKDNGEMAGNVEYAQGQRVVDEKPLTLIASNKSPETKLKTEPPKTVVQKKAGQDSPLPPVEENNSGISNNFYDIKAEIMPEPIGGMANIYRKTVFPKELRDKGIQGTVQVLAYVDENGDVKEAKVTDGVHPVLDESARMAVYYTRFKPGIQKGKRVKVQVTIPVEFKIYK